MTPSGNWCEGCLPVYQTGSKGPSGNWYIHSMLVRLPEGAHQQHICGGGVGRSWFPCPNWTPQKGSAARPWTVRKARRPRNTSNDGPPGVRRCASNRRVVAVDRLRSHLPASALAASESECMCWSHVTYVVIVLGRRRDSRAGCAALYPWGALRAARLLMQFGPLLVLYEVCRWCSKHMARQKKGALGRWKCGAGEPTEDGDWWWG